MMTTARPWAASRATRSSTWRVWATPSAAVGSSRMTRREFHMTAAPDRDGLPLAAGEARHLLADRADRRDRRATSSSRRLRLHVRLLQPADDVVAPRGRGTCSGRCRGCRTGRDPGRRPRSRAWPSRFGDEMETFSPSKKMSPLVDRVDPGDALDEGRLAGAVVADERHDLARTYLEVDIRQRLHRAEALGDVARLEHRRRGGAGRGGAMVSVTSAPSRVGRWGSRPARLPHPGSFVPSSTACTSRCTPRTS